jgi:hypothetical protein
VQRVGPGAGQDHVEAVRLQVCAQQLADRRLVVHDEDAAGHRV